MLIKNGTESVDHIDNILTLVMIYLVTRAYYGLFDEKNRINLGKALLKTFTIILMLSGWYYFTSPFIIGLKIGILGE